MEKHSNKRMLSLAVICISLFQMGMVGLSPVISAISEAYPSASELAAQMAATFLNLILVIVALLSGVISRRIGRRRMAIIGMTLFVLVAVCGRFFTPGLWAVYLWSGLLGAGTGLFVPAAASMLLDYFSEDERNALAGKQTAAVNIGGVAISLLSGALATKSWNNAYLIFLGALPVLLLCVKVLPQEKAKPGKGGAEVKKSAKIPAAVWLATLQTTIFAVLYFTFSTNVSLLLAERGFTSSTLAGTVTACFMLGGAVCGLLFTRVSGILKSKTAAGAFVLLSVSYFAIYAFDGMIPLAVGAFAGGGSLSIIFPFFLVTAAGRTDPAVSVLSTSLIISVGPNLGSFISPMIITNLSLLSGSGVVVNRFFTAAVLAAIGAAVLLAVDAISKKTGRKAA